MLSPKAKGSQLFFTHFRLSIKKKKRVIQDYRCSLDLKAGKMYITGNYGKIFKSERNGRLFLLTLFKFEQVLFHCQFPSQKLALNIRKIKIVEPAKTAFLFPTAIKITMEETQQLYHFTSFNSSHSEEAFHIISHLLKYSPHFVKGEEEEQSEKEDERGLGEDEGGLGEVRMKNSPGTNPSLMHFDSSKTSCSRSNSFTENTNNISPLQSNHLTSQISFNSFPQERANGINGNKGSLFHQNETSNSLESVQVDVQTSERALKKVLEAREIAREALGELDRQGGVVKRIEEKTLNIHSNLDNSEKSLKTIESFTGFLKKNTKQEQVINGEKDSPPPLCNTKNFKFEDIKVEILFKHKNDSLEECSLCLYSTWFACFEGEKQVEKRGSKYSYEQIKEIRVRSRPLHLDVVFKDKTERLRICSSSIQLILSQLWLRVNEKKTKVQVIFEEGAQNFSYKSLSSPSLFNNKREAQSQLLFSKKPSSLLSLNLPQQVQKDLEKQEDNLDKIEDVLQDLKEISQVIGEELDSQLNQLDFINEKVDSANIRIKNQNNRVKKLL